MARVEGFEVELAYCEHRGEGPVVGESWLANKFVLGQGKVFSHCFLLIVLVVALALCFLDKTENKQLVSLSLSLSLPKLRKFAETRKHPH